MDTVRPAADPATSAGAAPRRIVMLIYPGVAPLDVAGPLQVFGFTNFLMKRQVYDIVTVAPTVEPVATGLGFALLPACAMADVPRPIDTLLVAGGRGQEHVKDAEVSDWLARTAPTARRFGSICTGAFMLNDAGLIDGKRVATHWALGAELARRNPSLEVDLESIYVRDGNIYSTAGITAGIDLGLALLEEDHGRDFALKVARYLVLFLKRSGGQSRFSLPLQAQFSSIPPIQRVQLWCHENLDGDLRIGALAKHAAMSERSFLRAFREDTGRTPAEFVLSARLQGARRLLEETDLAPKAIAQRCGLGTAAAMRRVFTRELGISPTHYREKFHTRVAAAAPSSDPRPPRAKR